MYETNQETEETSLLQIFLHIHWILERLFKSEPRISDYHDDVQDVSTGER